MAGNDPVNFYDYLGMFPGMNQMLRSFSFFDDEGGGAQEDEQLESGGWDWYGWDEVFGYDNLDEFFMDYGTQRDLDAAAARIEAGLNGIPYYPYRGIVPGYWGSTDRMVVELGDIQILGWIEPVKESKRAELARSVMDGTIEDWVFVEENTEFFSIDYNAMIMMLEFTDDNSIVKHIRENYSFGGTWERKITLRHKQKNIEVDFIIEDGSFSSMVLGGVDANIISGTWSTVYGAPSLYEGKVNLMGVGAFTAGGGFITRYEPGLEPSFPTIGHFRLADLSPSPFIFSFGGVDLWNTINYADKLSFEFVAPSE